MMERRITRPRLLLHAFSTFRIGGPQMRFSQLANHFGERYRHVVVAMDDAYDAMARIDDGIDCQPLRVPVGKGKAAVIANTLRFRRVLKEIRPDLLVTYNWGATEWALANWAPLCRHIHIEDGFGPEEVTRQMPRRVITRRLALSRGSRVVLPSLTLYEVASRIWRLNERCLTYIPNGIDCRRFEATPDPELVSRFGLDGNVPVIGTVAVLRPEKNLGRLLDAFALVTQRRAARLIIVGDGPERAALEAKAAGLGIADRIVFTGQFAAPERLLPLFTLFGLSSDTEQMPLSVIEAMAAGLAVAGTDVGDVRHMVAAENVPYVTPPDSAALAGAMIALLDQPERRAAIAAANRDKARSQFDQAPMFLAYDHLFSH